MNPAVPPISTAAAARWMNFMGDPPAMSRHRRRFPTNQMRSWNQSSLIWIIRPMRVAKTPQNQGPASDGYFAEGGSGARMGESGIVRPAKEELDHARASPDADLRKLLQDPPCGASVGHSAVLQGLSAA